MIESSSYNGMAMATLVANIRAIKNRFIVKMKKLDNNIVNKKNNLKKNRLLKTPMMATSVNMKITL